MPCHVTSKATTLSWHVKQFFKESKLCWKYIFSYLYTQIEKYLIPVNLVMQTLACQTLTSLMLFDLTILLLMKTRTLFSPPYFLCHTELDILTSLRKIFFAQSYVPAYRGGLPGSGFGIVWSRTCIKDKDIFLFWDSSNTLVFIPFKKALGWRGVKRLAKCWGEGSQKKINVEGGGLDECSTENYLKLNVGRRRG